MSKMTQISNTISDLCPYYYVPKGAHAGGCVLQLKIKECWKPVFFEIVWWICAWMNLYLAHILSATRLQVILIYDLVPKGVHSGGGLSTKCVSSTLSCCFVCAFIIGQYHSGNNELQIWSIWSNIYIWKWKEPLNSTPENVMWVLLMLLFTCESKHHLSPICTAEISLYIVYI